MQGPRSQTSVKHGYAVMMSHIWIAIGFLGQGLFASRFLVQWIVSERHGESIIPIAFWYFSIAGGTIMLAYALWRQDPVFICGQAMGLLVYTRNLVLLHKNTNRTAEA